MMDGLRDRRARAEYGYRATATGSNDRKEHRSIRRKDQGNDRSGVPNGVQAVVSFAMANREDCHRI